MNQQKKLWVNSCAPEWLAIPAPLVTSVMLLSSNPVISQEWGKDGTVIMTNETYPLSFMTQICRNG